MSIPGDTVGVTIAHQPRHTIIDRYQSVPIATVPTTRLVWIRSRPRPLQPPPPPSLYIPNPEVDTRWKTISNYRSKTHTRTYTPASETIRQPVLTLITPNGSPIDRFSPGALFVSSDSQKAGEDVCGYGWDRLVASHDRAVDTERSIAGIVQRGHEGAEGETGGHTTAVLDMTGRGFNGNELKDCWRLGGQTATPTEQRLVVGREKCWSLHTMQSDHPWAESSTKRLGVKCHCSTVYH